MPDYLKEWLDAAASIAGLVAGMPYEPITPQPGAATPADTGAQLRLPLDEAPQHPAPLRRAA